MNDSKWYLWKENGGKFIFRLEVYDKINLIDALKLFVSTIVVLDDDDDDMIIDGV